MLVLPCSHPLNFHCTDLDDLEDELFVLPEQASGTITAGSLGEFVPNFGTKPARQIALQALVNQESTAVAVSFEITFRTVNGLEECPG